MSSLKKAITVSFRNCIPVLTGELELLYSNYIKLHVSYCLIALFEPGTGIPRMKMGILMVSFNFFLLLFKLTELLVYGDRK